MDAQRLTGRVIALLVADGFNQADYITIREGLESAGASTMVVSPTSGPIGRVAGWTGQGWGDHIPVDVPVDSVTEYDYDGVILPGGGASADAIRADAHSQQFLQYFLDEARPVGLVGEALRVAIGFKMTTGRRVAAPSDLAAELDLAGIAWADEPVVSYGHLITCRGSSDLAAFLDVFMDEVVASPLRPATTAKVSHSAFVHGTK